MMQQTTVSGSELVSPQRISSHAVTGEAPIRTSALLEASSSDPANFSPSVAHQLSGLIVNHWYACLAANEIRSDAPLDILDFSRAVVAALY